ncbi:MAG: DUF1330 domain-containing protein [bacterium]
MSAYIIVEIKIHNHEEYENYKKLTPATLKAYDGKFIVRGGESEILEGDWTPGRIVILEFSDMQQAKKWWSSEEYAPAKKIRQNCSYTKMILVEGFES